LEHIWLRYSAVLLFDIDEGGGSVAKWFGHPTANLVIPSFDLQLDLFQVVPGSSPWLCFYTANLSASCQLGFLLC